MRCTGLSASAELLVGLGQVLHKSPKEESLRIAGAKVFTVQMPVCHPINSVKALKE